MSHLRGAKDLAVEQVAGEEHLEIALDRDKLARYGLNIADVLEVAKIAIGGDEATDVLEGQRHFAIFVRLREDRKSTRLNSSHDQISYAVFCLKKKKETPDSGIPRRPPCRPPTGSPSCIQ